MLPLTRRHHQVYTYLRTTSTEGLWRQLIRWTESRSAQCPLHASPRTDAASADGRRNPTDRGPPNEAKHQRDAVAYFLSTTRQEFLTKVAQ